MPHYLSGFGNHFETEAIPGALIKGKNSPQKVPYQLYAEQLSGSAFTMPRAQNLHSWLYRIEPSVTHNEFIPYSHPLIAGDQLNKIISPNAMRWDPQPYNKNKIHFIDSLFPLVFNGSHDSQQGAAIYLYTATASMENIFMYNADGEYLIIPQEGVLQLQTEMGILDLQPAEIAIIPRGIKFSIQLKEDKARGYVAENVGLPFRLPDLGLIGANGLANPRDFLYPHAAYEDKKGDFLLLVKFQGKFFQTNLSHSPLDVVAWHGNYAPYKFDLTKFNTINSVSFDHPDPSIFTVLTSPSLLSGTANLDFVIFPPRWMVAKDTFRPPYYHRNIMSEYMGLITGVYDAKETGFQPGGGSLHNCMTAHGPDSDAFQKAIQENLEPQYYDNTLAFMLESKQVWQVTKAAYEAPFRQTDYSQCWKNLSRRFEQKMIER